MPLPYIGTTKLIESYSYYDQPVLFACKNEHGHIFMAVCSEETDDSEIWLYVGLSPRRFEIVRKGRIDLFETFASPEDNFIYRVEEFFTDIPPAVSKTPKELILLESLPAKGEFLGS